MTTTTTTTTRQIQRRRARRRDDSGFALVWFGISLVVLLVVSGAGVDVWSWWYAGNQHQRTADAAALAGVVFLPGDDAAARATALDIAAANGVDPTDVTIETHADDPVNLAENELRVTVARSVSTNFLRLAGIDDARISRSAVSEFTSSLQMGSPEPFLGRDPDRYNPLDPTTFKYDPGYWISVSGPSEGKVGGDRYTARACSGTDFGCTTAATPSNDEWDVNGYSFSVSMTSAPTGDLVIEAWDPVFTLTGGALGQSCGDTAYLDPAAYATHIADITVDTDASAAARYAPGDTIYCQGDVGVGALNPTATIQNVTTFMVRAPDATQASDTDNPVISAGQTDIAAIIAAERANLLSGATNLDTVLATASCTQQYRELDLNPDDVGGADHIYSLLNTGEGSDNDQTNSEGFYAQATYRRWVPVCTISQGVAAGWFAAGTKDVIVQVQPNLPLGDVMTDTRYTGRGRNHFSIRAGYGTADTPSGVTVQARGRLPLHNGSAGGSTTDFYVTRLPPGNAGRTISLKLFDVADSNLDLTFEIYSPSFPAGFADCTFDRFEGNGVGGQTKFDMSGDAIGCTLGIADNSLYNGHLAEVRVKVPAGYTCNIADPNDCWIKARVTYFGAGQVFDHTTWDADVIGEPVRLVE